MVLDLIRFVKQVDPDKLVIAGGVNARNLRERFFDAGVDVIVLSEAENIIVEIAEAVRGQRDADRRPRHRLPRRDRTRGRQPRRAGHDEPRRAAVPGLGPPAAREVLGPVAAARRPVPRGQAHHVRLAADLARLPVPVPLLPHLEGDDDHVAGAARQRSASSRSIASCRAADAEGPRRQVRLSSRTTACSRRRSAPTRCSSSCAEMGLDLSDVNGINIVPPAEELRRPARHRHGVPRGDRRRPASTCCTCRSSRPTSGC